MTPREVLLTAADLLRERGWTQDQYVSHDGSHCVLGAIYRAAGVPLVDDESPDGFYYGVRPNIKHPSMRDADDAINKLKRSLEMDAGWAGHPLVEWNDTTDQTADDVIAALERAAGKDTNEARD